MLLNDFALRTFRLYLKYCPNYLLQDGIFFPPKRELPAGAPGSRRQSKKDLKRQATEERTASAGGVDSVRDVEMVRGELV